MACIESPAVSPTATLASRNFAANLRAIAEVQSELIGSIGRCETEYNWISARDGSLTGMLPGGQWLAECSLPVRAAAQCFKTVHFAGTLACLLRPTHAAQISRALELLRPDQAVLVVVEDSDFLPAALHCADLAEYITDRRLFFAIGPEWQQQTKAIFKTFPGLPTPAIFLRLPFEPEAATGVLIDACQIIFAEVNAERNRQLSELTEKYVHTAGPIKRVCVVSPSQFRLWNDAGSVLAEVLESDASREVVRCDPDQAISAAHLGFASVAATCDAVITANFARADAPQSASTEQPWIAWITTPNIPDGSKAARCDRLILADPDWRSMALSANWQPEQIAIGAWPHVTLLRQPGVKKSIALIADTTAIRQDVDETTFELSSHLVLWELIQYEIQRDPFVIGNDGNEYLNSQLKRLGIAEEGFNRALFHDTLIIPAYQQGIARILIKNQVPMELHGQGWKDIEDLSPHASGPVTSRGQLHQIASENAACVLPMPIRWRHPADSIGIPVVRPAGMNEGMFLRQVRSAAISTLSVPRQTSLSAELVFGLFA